jgi:hypothetical protein
MHNVHVHQSHVPLRALCTNDFAERQSARSCAGERLSATATAAAALFPEH